MTRGAKMADMRKRVGFSRAELAKRSGVSVSTITRLETDKSLGSADSICMLASALGLTVDSYIDGPQAGGYIEVHIPYGSAREDPNLFIGINGANYLLPKGRTLKLPPAVADEYFRSLRAAEAFERTKEELTFKKDERCLI